MPTSKTQRQRDMSRQGGWGKEKDEREAGPTICPECLKKICGAVSPDPGPQRKRACSQEICHQKPGYGTGHPGLGTCKRHFGATPAVERAAAKREIRMEMRAYGVPVEIDPEDALREEIHRTVGHVRWLSEKVAQVASGQEPERRPVIDIEAEPGDDDDKAVARRSRMDRPDASGEEALMYGVAEVEEQAGGPGGGFYRVKMAAGPNAWLQAYMAERKHLADITRIALAAGLEARRLDWAEAMADRLINGLEQFAEALGHDPRDPAVRLMAADALGALMKNAKAS